MPFMHAEAIPIMKESYAKMVLDYLGAHMEFQGFPKIPRLFRDIVVTEKIDGTNTQVLVEPVTGTVQEFEKGHSVPLAYVGLVEYTGLLAIYAGSRSRFIDPQHDNHGFARWVMSNSVTLARLGPGKHFGEWWGQGINRGYGLKEKRFSLFNVAKWHDDTVRPACCHVVPALYHGEFSTSIIKYQIGQLREFGSVAAPGFMKPEGVVVYHTAGNLLFKATIENDEKPKGQV